MLDSPFIAFITRTCVLPDPHPVAMITMHAASTPVATAFHEPITKRSLGIIFEVLRSDAMRFEESC
jgi:hypothetical protein